MLAPLRIFHRLRGPPDVVADIFRRPALEMRHLAVQPLETLVEPPAQRRRPAEAGLDHHHLQFRIALEHAFEHEARQRGLLALRMADHLLDVKARPARRGDRIAAEAEGVDADRQADLLRRLIDRPVAALAERLDVAARAAAPARNSCRRRACGFRRPRTAPSSLATTIEPFRRQSLLVHFSICQSLIAVASAAPRSWLRRPCPVSSGLSTPSATL